MTPELIAILAVGVGLAGLMWQSMRRMETRMEARIAEVKQDLGGRIDGVRNELGARIDDVKGELGETKRDLGARIDGLAEEMREMRDRLGRLEGKMDFVYDYITRRNDPAPAAE